MPARRHKDYYACDLMSDILSAGESARLSRSLVKEQKLFSEIGSYITGDVDEGLFVVSGKVNEGVDIRKAEAGIRAELDKLIETDVDSRELEKVKNRMEVSIAWSELKVADKAMNLSYFELLGDAGLWNDEVKNYRAVTQKQIRAAAKKILRDDNASVLYYLADAKKIYKQT